MEVGGKMADQLVTCPCGQHVIFKMLHPISGCVDMQAYFTEKCGVPVSATGRVCQPCRMEFYRSSRFTGGCKLQYFMYKLHNSS